MLPPLVLLMLVLCALGRFAQLEEKAIISLASALKPFQAMKGDIIYNEGDVGTEMCGPPPFKNGSPHSVEPAVSRRLLLTGTSC